MASYSPFVPLRIYSSFTMLDGAIDPKAIAKLAKTRGFPAIAITDKNGLYAAPAFSSACKDAGIQPIVGTALAIARPEGQCLRRLWPGGAHARLAGAAGAERGGVAEPVPSGQPGASGAPAGV
jgi:DNA polymerase III alpha subunit